MNSNEGKVSFFLNDLLPCHKDIIITWLFWGIKGEGGGENTNDGDICGW